MLTQIKKHTVCDTVCNGFILVNGKPNENLLSTCITAQNSTTFVKKVIAVLVCKVKVAVHTLFSFQFDLS